MALYIYKNMFQFIKTNVEDVIKGLSNQHFNLPKSIYTIEIIINFKFLRNY